MANTARQALGGLDAETLRTMYRHMLRSRVLDERMWVLNRQGRAPFWISGMGHEAAQVAVAMQLTVGTDWIAPYYRDLALMLVLGMTPEEQILSVLAKADDPNSGGRQMPAHYGCRRLNVITTGSPVCTQLLHAAGLALASKIRGDDAITLVAFGEGSTSGGDFHEAVNFAATRRLPVIFMVENNGYAISVPLENQMPTPAVADRAKGYNIPGLVMDGRDALECYQTALEAVHHVRSGAGPVLLEANVVRLTSHSSDDDQRRYRTAEALEADRAADCLILFRDRLAEMGVLSRADADEIRNVVQQEVDRATEVAERAPDPESATAMLHVLGEGE
ncbi:MAG: thiamine pyrophosphate-dependent dehydrogenase E1 component subunit alpha [Candidatus Dormibacteria bacterium]